LCEGTGEDKQEGKLLERVMNYWLGLLERDETSIRGHTGTRKGGGGKQLDEQNETGNGKSWHQDNRDNRRHNVTKIWILFFLLFLVG
jgi:hypothetical protein